MIGRYERIGDAEIQAYDSKDDSRRMISVERSLDKTKDDSERREKRRVR